MKIEFTNKQGEQEIFYFRFVYADGALVNGTCVMEPEKLAEKDEKGRLVIKESQHRRICKCVVNRLGHNDADCQQEEIAWGFAVLHPWDTDHKCEGRKIAFERAIKLFWGLYAHDKIAFGDVPNPYKIFARILWRMFLTNVKFPGRKKPMSQLDAERFIAFYKPAAEEIAEALKNES